jgi:hypothetical protein
MKRVFLFPMAMLGAALLELSARGEELSKAECVAANSDAQDLRREGKLLSAREKLAICVSTSCPEPVRQDCAERLDEVGKAMPSVVFDVMNASGRYTTGVTITMDGQPLPAGTGTRTAIELDPGVHTFTFDAHGQHKVEKKLVFAMGAKRRRFVFLADASPTIGETTGPSSARAPVRATIASAAPKDDAARSSGPPMLAWAAFGIGGAGLLLGITAGLVAGGRHARLAGECDNRADACAPKYIGDLQAFHMWRTVSTVSYVGGALGVASGVTIWLTAPKRSNVTALGAWIGPAAVRISGRF